jgi:uncharacterized membrane protein
MAAKTIKTVQEEVQGIRKLLLRQHPPRHFSFQNVVVAAFGALLLGLTFIFKGLLFEVSLKLTPLDMAIITVTTLVLLTLEIQFIAYARVSDKRERPFGQFWLKRITAFYGIALLVSFGLIHLYGLHRLVDSPYAVLQMAIAVSMPCAIGTALTDLLKE